MSGDQIAGVIGFSMMLLIVVPRLASRQMQFGTMMRMAMAWAVIILVAIAAFWLGQHYMHLYLT